MQKLRKFEALRERKKTRKENVINTWYFEIGSICIVMEFDMLEMFQAQKGFMLKSWGKIFLIP